MDILILCSIFLAGRENDIARVFRMLLICLLSQFVVGEASGTYKQNGTRKSGGREEWVVVS